MHVLVVPYRFVGVQAACAAGLEVLHELLTRVMEMLSVPLHPVMERFESAELMPRFI
jgi:hypothetical protein